MGPDQRARLLREAISRIAARCPRLSKACYWAGTSAIATEELGHRESFDIDLHTRDALVDTRLFLAELERAFPGAFEVVEPPDAHGSGFTGVLSLEGGEKLTVEVFAGFESVADSELVVSATAPNLRRVTLELLRAEGRK